MTAENLSVFLCSIDELPAGGCKNITLDDAQGTNVFIVRRQQQLHGYINACPHTGAPLNWGKDDFLSLDGRHIQCALHGALFRIHDGYCIWGPCLHRSLTAIALHIHQGRVYLQPQTNGDSL